MSDMPFRDAATEEAILDGTLLAVSGIGDLHPGLIRAMQEGEATYDVVRIIRGVPVFWEDHLMRMDESVKKTANRDLQQIFGKEIYSRLRGMATQVAGMQPGAWNPGGDAGAGHCNVKFIITADPAHLMAYVSQSYYPSVQEAEEGLPVDLFLHDRSIPSVKKLDLVYKQAVQERMQQLQVFELLLVNRDGYITEGSRSNVFFLLEDRIITSPLYAVLPGITRRYVLEACRNAGVKVEEKLLHRQGLGRAEAAFLSGTSIKVQPISRIGEIILPSGQHPVVRRIRQEYDRLLQNYIEAWEQAGSTGG
ncbi:MAG TPA: hypothetical protein DD727_07910 [Clostridiales bacterium]|nr:hypothetical protein [Clostridiales bacterium]